MGRGCLGPAYVAMPAGRHGRSATMRPTRCSAIACDEGGGGGGAVPPAVTPPPAREAEVAPRGAVASHRLGPYSRWTGDQISDGDTRQVTSRRSREDPLRQRAGELANAGTPMRGSESAEARPADGVPEVASADVAAPVSLARESEYRVRADEN